MVVGLFRLIYEMFVGSSLRSNVIIDNCVFRLHYKITGCLLLTFATVLTCRQFFGDPIDCLSGDNAPIDNQALDTFCWIFSTFTVNKHLHGTMGADIIFPGVGISEPNEEDVIRQKYYQWVIMLLILQSVLFYMPRFLWLSLEGRQVQMVAGDLNDSISNSSWTTQRISDIVNYVTVWKLNKNKFYTVKFAFCELLNFLVTIGQLYAVDHLFGDDFIYYGQDLLNSLLSSEYNGYSPAMDRVFPKIAKCSFRLFGPSGSIQNIEAICILPQNILNEKIFGFCFFWFGIVAIVSSFGLMYRMSFFDTRIRFLMLHNRFEKVLPSRKFKTIFRSFDFGDCFFLCQLGKNINPYFFDQLLKEIASKLEDLTFDDDGSFVMLDSYRGEINDFSFVDDLPDYYTSGSSNMEKDSERLIDTDFESV